MKIALFLPNWIGDAVMATPAIRAVREQYPQAELLAVCKPYVAGLLGGNPWFQRTYTLDRRGPWCHRWFAAALNLRREHVDLSILFPNTFRSALTAWLGRSRRIVGFRRYGRGWLLSDRLEAVRDDTGAFRPLPVIDDYNRLAMAAGCPDPGHRMELFTTPADMAHVERIWDKHHFHAFKGVTCLNPGAAFGSSKLWSADSFARLAQFLYDRRGHGVLVLCGPSERDMSRQIARMAHRPGVHSLADEPLSLGLTKAAIRQADLLVTTDSGPRHFAAAFNRPVVTLFGPTHIEWTETYYEPSIHMQKKVPCGPCQKRRCPLDHRCMTELYPEDVFQAAIDLLDRRALPMERRAS
jgi:heptosyltransferase-2